jgi:transcriptional regulator with XRE-family HTH domain
VNKRLNIDTMTAAMERSGFNASRLAAQLGVSREAVSNWLSGESFPRPDKLLKLALTLALRFEELVIRETPDTTPVIAFRKRGASKTTDSHVRHAQEIGRLLRHLVSYLPFDRFVRPAILKQPVADYPYLQDLVAKIRAEAGVPDGEAIDFRHLIQRFRDLQAVLVPVLWGEKDKHENALHIFLPDSMTTWVYLNLDVQVHDFKYWMAHELGHVLAPDLRGDEGEDFADAFAGALLFPQPIAQAAYERVSARSSQGGRVNQIKKIAEEHLISPITVYMEINRYAKHADRPIIELGRSIFGAAKNLSKDYKTLSAVLFEGEHPEAVLYLRRSAEIFDTPFFEVLREYLRDRDKGAGFVQSVLDIPLLDAREIHAALT